MIFTSIYSDYKSQGLHPVLLKVIDFLKETDFSDIGPGEYELEGRDIFYQVHEIVTEELEKRSPESHKEYIDCQFVVKGEEKIGTTRLKDSYSVKEYFENRDLIFYQSVEDEGYIHAVEGCVSVFFPEDVHKPQIAVKEPADEKKVVVKIRTSLLSN